MADVDRLVCRNRASSEHKKGAPLCPMSDKIINSYYSENIHNHVLLCNMTE